MIYKFIKNNAGNNDKYKTIINNFISLIEYLNKESKKRFEDLKEMLDLLQINYEVDPKIVRGLDYYNHVVFEIEDINENMGINNVIGAGGRYNGLVSQLDGPETACVGFASGIGRILDAVEAEKVELPITDSVDLFLLYVNDDEKKSALYYADEVRMAGYIVDTEYTGKSLKSQFKKADKLKAKYICVLNSEQLKNGEMTIKNNSTKEEEVIGCESLIYYLDEKLNSGIEDDVDIDELMKGKMIDE